MLFELMQLCDFPRQSSKLGYGMLVLQHHNMCAAFMLRAKGTRGKVQHLDGAQQGNSGGVIDDTFPEHQVEQQWGPVLLKHLQHRHTVCSGKNRSQCQAVLCRWEAAIGC